MEPDSPDSDFSRRAFVTTVVGALGAAGVAAALPGTAAAAEPSIASEASTRVARIDTYLRATGVTGDSVARNYRDWIEVVEWSWGTLGTVAEPLAFSTRIGRYTAGLLSKAFTAEPITEVALRGAINLGEIVRLTLQNAVVAQGSAHSAAVDNDIWSITSYSKATFEVRTVDARRGELGPWTSMTWSITSGVVS